MGERGIFQNKSCRKLSSHLSELIVSFSRSAAEAATLNDAANYEILDALLDADVTKLRELGCFDALINIIMISGKNLVDTVVVIDTAANFTPIHRTAKFRNMQIRLLPVYRKAVAGMHASNKVLLFRIADIPHEIYDVMHRANEYHWRPEPGKIADRPILDCFNCVPGEIPLNSEETKW